MTTITPTVSTRPTYTIDASHSEVGFAVKHLMISTVKGSFRNVSGKIELDTENVENSVIEADIETASIETRQEQRDAHLRSADFFDVEKYPTMTFRSRRVEPRGDTDYRVIGDLTIRDVTKEVVLNVEETGRGKDPWGGERIGYTASTKIDRSDFGLTYNMALEAGGFVIGDEIRITLEIEAVLA